MKIKYLTLLRDNPSDESEGTQNRFVNIPMTVAEIEYLEQKYNAGKKFPGALRELLFLSGKRSYVNDILYAGNLVKTPNPHEKMNDKARADLLADNNGVNPISRPFYVIDWGEGSGAFEFVYLDEGDDPAVYASVTNYTEQTRDWEGVGNTKNFKSISEMVRIRVEELLARNNVPVNYGK